MHFRHFCRQAYSVVFVLAIFLPVISALAETVITSDRLEKYTEGDQDHFLFYDNVRIVATNLVVTCDTMEVITEGKLDEKGSVPQFGAIETIIAKGNVKVDQEISGRTACADEAQIFPQKGEVVLTGNAEVTDAQGTVRGHRMRLVKGEERAIVEGNAEGDRPKVLLPMMPDWSPVKKAKPDDSVDEVSQESSANSQATVEGEPEKDVAHE